MLEPLLALFLLLPFRIGEKALYHVKYGPFKAGTMKLSVVDTVRIRGRLAYHFLLKAETGDPFSAFFKVADEIHSYVDVETFATLRYEKHLREGKYRADRIVDYMPDSGKAVYPDGDTVEISHGALDPLAVFYFVRLRRIESGETLRVPYHVDRRSMTLVITAERYKNFKTPMGEFRSLKVVPDFKGVNVFKSRRGMELWICPELSGIPLQIKTKLFIGSLRAEIFDYFPGSG